MERYVKCKIAMNLKDAQIYFTTHKTIDPFHTTEILSGIRKMKPQLEKKELKKILSGACQAVQLVLSCMTNLKNISMRGAL